MASLLLNFLEKSYMPGGGQGMLRNYPPIQSKRDTFLNGAVLVGSLYTSLLITTILIENIVSKHEHAFNIAREILSLPVKNSNIDLQAGINFLLQLVTFSFISGGINLLRHTCHTKKLPLAMTTFSPVYGTAKSVEAIELQPTAITL